MELKPWLDEERGRYGALAQHLGVSVGRISQIAVSGVPVKYMQAVRDFSGGAVSVEEMVEERTPSKDKEKVA